MDGPAAALALAGTLLTGRVGTIDLLDTDERHAAWWAEHRPEAGPDPTNPDPAATRSLRAAIRELLDARLDRRTPDDAALRLVNRVAEAAPTSIALTRDGRSVTRWHPAAAAEPGQAVLAVLARQTIELLGTPALADRLRRCAHPDCSTLFIAATTRRVWCSSGGCGNRVRVARHYRLRHAPPE